MSNSENDGLDNQTSYEGEFQTFISNMNNVRKRVRAISYDDKNNVTYCATFLNAKCLFSDKRQVSTIGHQHYISDVFKKIVNDDNTVTLKPLDEILDGKANNEHKHSIDDIGDDITKIVVVNKSRINEEEEEELFEEEEEIIEHIPLRDVLDSKADESHKHSIDDITKTVTKTVINEETGEEETITETRTLDEVLNDLALQSGQASEIDLSDYATKNELTNGSLDANIKSIVVNTTNTITRPFDIIYPGSLGSNKFVRFGISDSAGSGVFGYGKDKSSTYYCYMKIQNQSAELDVLKNLIRLDSNSTVTGTLTVNKNVTMPSMTLNNQDINKVSTSTNYDIDKFNDNQMLTALAIKSFVESRPLIEHTHTLSDISDYSPPDLSPYAKQTDIEPLIDDIDDLSKGKANMIHTHSMSDITDYTAPDLTPYATKDELNTKANINHEHTLSEISDYVQPDLSPYVTKEELNNKANVNHEHTLSEISDYVQPDLSPYVTKEELNTKADGEHEHTTNDITGFNDDVKSCIESTTLDTLSVGTITNTTINADTVNAGVVNINNQSLNEVLDTKANVNHTHTLSEISDYSPPDLTPYVTKEELNNKANVNHEHPISDIVALDTTLGNKSDVGHTHTLSEISDYSPPDLTPYATITELNNKANSVHNHTTSEISNIEKYVKDLISEALRTNIDRYFQQMYPIGSVFISTMPLYRMDLGVRYHVIPGTLRKEYMWNGCLWIELPQNTFLRNGYTPEGSIYEDGMGESGGSLTHTHTTNDHTLKENEVPKKTWTWRGEDYHRSNLDYSNTNGDYIENTQRWVTVSDGGDYSVVKKFTQSYGGGGSHNHGDTGEASNLPPYLTVFMYKRIHPSNSEDPGYWGY